LQTVPCNLCGETCCTPVYEIPDRRFFPEEFFTVVECNRCGLGFVNPRPSLEEMAKYYPAEYFAQPNSTSFERYLQRRFEREARYLRAIETRVRTPRLLDVGCATGDFPRFMAARGWNVEGVETSASAAAIRDFKVYRQQFPEIPVHEPAYDAVTAWAVLEHVHDPLAHFRKASVVLKKGGLFLFLVTNFESAASRHLFCEDVPRHLYFFTRKTIRRYLDAAGLTLEAEHNGRDVYKMAPINWLPYFLKTRIQRQKFLFRDVPLTPKEFLRRHHLHPGLVSSLRYAAYSPASVLDRILWPVIESVQILRKTYGISTFLARKP
jgi:SAM-dependent methyltransferase